MNFHATKSKVFTRGIPPDSFLRELVEWGKQADASLFEPNAVYDVYSSVSGALGPYPNMVYRRCCMLEVLRVLAGFESSWNWNEGRDTSAGPETPEQMEAGAWQMSADSAQLGDDLKAMFDFLTKDATVYESGSKTHDSKCYAFQAAMKSNHTAAMEYITRLLRHTVSANGPALRHEIDPYLSRESVAEFQTLLGT